MSAPVGIFAAMKGTANSGLPGKTARMHRAAFSGARQRRDGRSQGVAYPLRDPRWVPSATARRFQRRIWDKVCFARIEIRIAVGAENGRSMANPFSPAELDI